MISYNINAPTIYANRKSTFKYVYTHLCNNILFNAYYKSQIVYLFVDCIASKAVAPGRIVWIVDARGGSVILLYATTLSGHPTPIPHPYRPPIIKARDRTVCPRAQGRGVRIYEKWFSTCGEPLYNWILLPIKPMRIK